MNTLTPLINTLIFLSGLFDITLHRIADILMNSVSIVILFDYIIINII